MPGRSQTHLRPFDPNERGQSFPSNSTRRSFLRAGFGCLAFASCSKPSPVSASPPPPPAPAAGKDAWLPLFKESFSLMERDCLYEMEPYTVMRKMLVLVRKQLPPGDAKAVEAKENEVPPDKLPEVFGLAINRVVERAANGPTNAAAVMQSVLQQYARSLDRYSDYMTPEDLAVFQALQGKRNVGLGFDMVEGQDGLFRCFPLPAEAAELAGLVPGDLLLAIDGQETKGLTRYKIGALSLGKEGSVARLRVQSEGEDPRELDIPRAAFTVAPIQVKQVGGETTIRIRRFIAQTTRDIEAVLLQLPRGSNLVIDLKNCPGRELDAAIACASLFLGEGQEVCRTVTRVKNEIHLSKNKSPFRAGRLVLEQNEGTASAAELFIAALTADPATRAVSRGPVTFGKGMTQLEYDLKAGGALSFTDARLLGPGGKAWDLVGLKPTDPN